MEKEQAIVLTWEDIRKIRRICDEYDTEIEDGLWAWSMDEDQMGIPHPIYSKITAEDFYKEALRRFVRTRNNK